MEIRVLGPLAVAADDGEEVVLGSRKQRALLAALALEAGRTVGAERLVDALWPDGAPASARNSLQSHVSRLRRALGGDRAPVSSHPTGYRLDRERVEVDAVRFEQLLRDADGAPPAEAADLLATALSLWRGPALGEFAADFAHPAVVRLDELRLGAVERRARALLEVGRPEEAVPELEAAAAEEPLREQTHLLLGRSLARAGRAGDALDVLRTYADRVRDELGLDPSSAHHEVEAAVLWQAEGPAGATPAAPAGSAGSSAPPAGSPGPAAAPRTDVSAAAPTDASTDGPTAPAAAGEPPAPDTADLHLPAAATSLVGREAEVARLTDDLAGARVVTAVGPGGVGKTRVALEVARRLAADGEVAWVELAPLEDARAVVHAVAESLRLPPRSPADAEAALVGALRHRGVTLVLDNCEHVVDEVARLVERVVSACPEVRVLATSRERLAVPGERSRALAPLGIQDVGVGEPEAVQLLRARVGDAAGADVADGLAAGAALELCRRLDGLPLAIELAAARVGALGIDDLTARLHVRFELLAQGVRPVDRHRTLRAAVEWSYDLLDEDERRLLDRLSVFAGVFGLPAAEAVCADGALPAERVAGVLARLVDQSVVHVPEPGRYRLLETLRAYARERLEERGELEIQHRRHAAWCVEVVEAADSGMRSPDEATWVATLADGLDDLRTAHGWSREHAPDLAVRLTAGLHRFAYPRGRYELLGWAAEIAEDPRAADEPKFPAVLATAAAWAWGRGEHERARRYADAAVALEEAELPSRALAWAAAGDVRVLAGQLDAARVAFARAVELAEAADDGLLHGENRSSCALVEAYAGRPGAAVELADAGRERAEAVGAPSARAYAAYVQGEALADREPDAALAHLAEARDLAGRVDARFMDGLARVAAVALRSRHGSSREALEAFEEVVRHWRRLGNVAQQWTTLRNLVDLLARLGIDEEAVALDAAAGVSGGAAQAFGAEEERRTTLVGRAAERLGPDAAAAARERGAGLDAEAAVDLALEAIARATQRSV